jgi:hypothetical protein
MAGWNRTARIKTRVVAPAAETNRPPGARARARRVKSIKAGRPLPTPGLQQRSDIPFNPS